MSRPPFVPLIFTVFLASCVVEAPLPDELDRVRGAIMNGYPAHADSAVVGIVSFSGFGGFGICSGTLIAPNVVLTAQHCVAQITGSQGGGVNCQTSGFAAPYPANGLFVSTQQQLTQNPNDYHATKATVIPPGEGVCGRDVALMVLQDPVPATEAEPLVVRVDTALIGGTPGTFAQGEDYSAIGYGNTGQFGGSGARRRRDGLRVTCEGATCFMAGAYATEWLGDEGVCQGDSGGPAVDAFERVVGVASRGGNNCSFPIYGYPFGWADWLKTEVTKATEEAGLEPPRWTTGWPTHPSWNVSSGQPCTNGNACESLLCLDGYCSRPCSEQAPCDPGFYCGDVPAGSALVDADYCHLVPVGGACETHDDCTPGLCRGGVCTRECGADLPCPNGFLCNDEIFVCELIEVGKPCGSFTECLSGDCHDEGYCTRPCFGVCPANYECIDHRCQLLPLGDECDTNGDCASGQCLDGLCTHGCSSLAICQDDAWTCGDEALCTLIEVGGECTLDTDCTGDAICQDELCTRTCDDVRAPCPERFECRADGLCAAIPTPAPDPACSTGTPGSPAPLFLLLLLLSLVRRRHAH